MYWDDDVETPPLSRQALHDIMGARYTDCAENGVRFKDLMWAFKVHKRLWQHEWLVKQVLAHFGMLLEQSFVQGTFADDPFALEHFLVHKRRRATDWNLIAGLQQEVAAMTKQQQRSSSGRSRIAALRARLAFVGVERTDTMKYYMAARKHFAGVMSVSVSVDNSRLGCMDTMLGVVYGQNRHTKEELTVVLPPQDTWALHGSGAPPQGSMRHCLG